MMAACTTCGEIDFECIDGLYYCVVCQTQSQHLIQEEHVEDTMPASFTLAIKKTGEKKKKEKIIEKGRQWSTYEAFQVIIQSQAKALIKLGANKELEDIVFQIWVLYLSKVGFAFTDEEGKTRMKEKLMKLHPRHRELYPGTCDDPDIKPIRYLRTYIKKRGNRMTKSKAKKKHDQFQLEQTLGGVEFYDGDNPLEEETVELNAEESELAKEEEVFTSGKFTLEENEDGDIFKKPRPYHINTMLKAVERMSLKLTICFCHIGLMYTNPSVTVSDILKWIKLGKVPYKATEDNLPEDMKFCNYDNHALYMPTIPSPVTIRQQSKRLVMLLGLSDFPPVHLNQIASRLLLQMNLPGEFHGLVNNSLKKTSPTVQFNLEKWCPAVPAYELTVMAHIIFIIKVLFGLDNEREKELSELARSFQDIVSADHPLFLWQEWVAFWDETEMTQRFELGNENLGPEETLLKVRPNTARNARYGRRRHKYLVNRKEKRVDLARPFRGLLESFKLKSATRNQSATGDGCIRPQSPKLDFVSSTLDTDPMEDLITDSEETVETPSCNKRKNRRDFSHHTVKYITEGRRFLDQNNDRGLSKYTIESSCMSESESDSDEKREEIKHGDIDENFELSQDLFLCSEAKSRMPNIGEKAVTENSNKRKIAANKIKAILKKRKKQKPGDESSEKIVELINRMEESREQYVIYHVGSSAKHTKFHPSYEWLLELCSQIVLSDRKTIHLQVRKLEQEILEQ